MHIVLIKQVYSLSELLIACTGAFDTEEEAASWLRGKGFVPGGRNKCWTNDSFVLRHGKVTRVVERAVATLEEVIPPAECEITKVVERAVATVGEVIPPAEREFDKQV